MSFCFSAIVFPHYGRLLARSFIIVGFVGLCSMATGCASNAPSADPKPTEITVGLPKVKARAETSESQTKSGLTIALASADYTVRVVDRTRLEQYQASFAEQMMITGDTSAMVFAHLITGSAGVSNPNHLKFIVTLNNQMPRVFHGGGTVVQFKVGGKLMAVDQAGYAELQNAIVPPRTEQQIVIYGPPLSEIPPSGVIGVFFYDVVTNQNEAGVVTEKQNYEWYYDYTVQNRTVPGHPDRVRDLRMMPAQYDAMQQTLQLQQAGQEGTPVPTVN